MSKWVSRQEWGARPPKSVKAISRSDGIFVHHTGAPESQTIKTIQNFHMDSKGWQDIAYSFLVDRYGNIYVGRGWGVAGGHTEGYNSTSHAVCYMANTDEVTPTPEGLAALNDVIAEHERRYGGFVKGHGQVNSTGCPGGNLRNWLASGRPVAGYVPGNPGPSTPPPTAADILRKGDRGDRVRELQSALNYLGYKLSVDGVFGSGTESAVKDFQSRRGIVSDGIVGASTNMHLAAAGFEGWKVNAPAAPTPPAPLVTLRRGSSGAKVKELQVAFQKLGWWLVADGVFGPATEAVVREFQGRRKITVDGIAGPSTQMHIAAAAFEGWRR